jgi:gliding motility-associated-like protein
MLTNTSTISKGSIVQNIWNYGSGNTSTDKNPIISFPVSGIHPVKLTVTSDKNCVDTVTKNVDIQDSIKANFNFTDSLVCKLNVTQLISTSLGKNLAHNWNFGDNTTATATNPTHQYAAAGSYPIRLIVSNAACGSDSITKTIRVFDGGLNVDWRAFSDCYYKDIFFKDSAVALFNDITGYTWSFGDGDTVYTANATHQYASPGIYSASFTVSTLRGCINTVTKSIEAYPQPHADFNAPSICLYKPFILQNTSTISKGSITKYTWDLGNGTILNTVSPVHTLNQTGNYPIKLVAVSDKNCNDSITKDIAVTDSLRANFALAKPIVCLNENVSFLDSSIGTNITRNWDFGDLTNSTDVNPNHTYTQVLPYNVKLIVSSPTCGSDSIIKRINVIGLPVIELGDGIELCPGNSQLVQLNGSLYDSILWSNSTTKDSISVTTDLNPLQVVVYKNGCSSSDVLSMIIKCDVFVPTAFTPNNDGDNDVYGLINKNIKSLHLKIFTRWGQLIFESDDPTKGWDGTYKGERCLIDNYVYYATGLTMDDKPFSVKGSLTLLR